jgi:hypothetical protein
MILLLQRGLSLRAIAEDAEAALAEGKKATTLPGTAAKEHG